MRLRGHTPAHVTPESTETAGDNIFPYRRPVTAAETRRPRDAEDSPAAFQLVYQLADVIRQNEDHAAETEARAQALVKRAIEELHLADTRVRSAEIARNAAEADLNETHVRVEEFERTLEHMQGRICTAETQLSAAILRAETAETRAAEATKALRLLEDAIRTQLLRARGQASSPSAAAA
jgi:chromosome segregation ATPase